jgi:hypothetical protein
MLMMMMMMAKMMLVIRAKEFKLQCTMYIVKEEVFIEFVDSFTKLL